MDLELRHSRRRTITVPTNAENAHRGRARSRRRASAPPATSSSSTATTSPTARSSRCPRARHHRRPTHERAARVHQHAFKLLADYRPKGVAVAWDSRPVHRAAAAEAADVVYKEGRKPMPDLLREQFPHFRPIVEAFGYRYRAFEGWEADDVIATLATRADTERDQDLRRLDRPGRVSALQREHLPDDDAARGRGRQRLHAGARRGRYGVTPSRCRTSSGSRATPRRLPGVPGIGDKTAGQLIAQYGSL